MQIKHLAKVLSYCDATHESTAAATARFALCELNPTGIVVFQHHIDLLANILEAYAYALQESGVKVNGDDQCKGD